MSVYITYNFAFSPHIKTSVIKVIALRGSPTSQFSTSMLFNIRVSCKYLLMNFN